MTPLENPRNGAGGHAQGDGHPPSPAHRIKSAPVAATNPPENAPSAEAPELTLAKLRGGLTTLIVQVRARWRAGLLAAALVAIGLSWALFRGATETVAETTLVAENPIEKILNPGEGPPGEQRQENMLRNHLSVMASNSFLDRLAASFSADEALAIQGPYAVAGPGAQPSLAQLLAKKIDVERERGRDFFIVRARHFSPPLALLLANRFAEQYLEFVRAEYLRPARGGLALLEQQSATLTEEIRKLEDERRAYRKSFGFITVEENQGVIGDRLRRINSALSDIRIQRVSVETQLRGARAASAASPTPFNDPTLANFGPNQALRVELSRLRAQREVLATQYGPNHPKMIEVDRTSATVQRSLEENFQLALADLQSRLDLVAATEKELSEGLTSAFNQSLELDKQAGRFNSLGEELAAKIKARATLLEHIAHTGLALELPANALRIIDRAYLAEGSRRRRLLQGGIVVLALGAFLLVPWLLHLFDGNLSASVDLERVLGRELLGAIPRMRGIPPQRRAHVVRDAGDAALNDRFLGIVDRIELLSPATRSKVILVTSTLPEEGKSVIASNLAAAFTRLGRKTVLVDCDCRRSTQHLLHEIPGARGLLAWAQSGFPLDENLLAPHGPLGCRRLADGTFLVPAGGNDDRPSRHFGAPAMQTLFERLRQEFEIVLVDTPPSGVFQDALLLARFCTATIVVGRVGVAGTAQVKRVIDDFDETAAPVLGLVLNDFSPRAMHPAVAYRHLGVDYGYQNQQRTRSAAGKPRQLGAST